ncbi:MAG: hypothetical protein N2053_00280 [Chitinispirillaceae bacterium]|nr:hypothetical protein [Chitinispirillaceae bacterium]
MEKIIYVLLILIIFFPLNAAFLRPFPEGYAMGNLGTIFYKNSPSEFDPFSPASLLTDTLHIGLSFSSTNFYDEMDDYKSFSLYSVNTGFFASFRKFGFKSGVSELNVFGIYKEQSVILSAAVSLLKNLKISAELSGIRFVLNNSDWSSEEWFTMAELGFSARATFFNSSIVTRVEPIIKKYWRNNNNSDYPLLSFIISLHTKHPNIGAQGISFKITPEYEKSISFTIGMEFEISNPIKIQCAIADNPFFIAFGVTAFLNNGNVSFALVNHPFLGWSKGFGVQYYKYLPRVNQR